MMMILKPMTMMLLMTMMMMISLSILIERFLRPYSKMSYYQMDFQEIYNNKQKFSSLKKIMSRF